MLTQRVLVPIIRLRDFPAHGYFRKILHSPFSLVEGQGFTLQVLSPLKEESVSESVLLTPEDGLRHTLIHSGRTL